MSQQLQPQAPYTRLRYIGQKDKRRDNVIADSGIVWTGYGDEQDVATVHVQKYLVHADVWERATVPVRPRPPRQVPQAMGAVTAAVPVYTGNLSVAGIVFPVEVLVAMVLASSGLTIERWNAATAGDRTEAIGEMLEQMRDAANDWGKAKFAPNLRREVGAGTDDEGNAQMAQDQAKAQAQVASVSAPVPRGQVQRAKPAAGAPTVEVPKVTAPPAALE